MILQQNSELVKTGGFENFGRSLYPNTSVAFEIPLIGGKLIHGLNEEEVKKVEAYYGYSFDSKPGIEFFKELKLNLPEHMTSLNIEDNVQDLLSYRLGVQLGLIAESKEKTKSPMCNALFFVYDSELETGEKVKLNRLKAKIMGKVSDWYDDNPDYLIKVGKYLFESYSVWTVDKALNDIQKMLEEHTERNKNIQLVNDAVNLDEEKLSFTVDIKEAISRSIIRKNTKGNYYNSLSNTEFGKTFESVYSSLQDNPDEMGTGDKSDSHYSIRKQLLKN